MKPTMEQLAEAEAKCGRFMDTGLACRDCDCGNDQYWAKDTSPAPWSKEKIAAHKDAEQSVLLAALVAEVALTGMAHAEAIYGKQIAGEVLDLLDAINELRRLEGTA